MGISDWTPDEEQQMLREIGELANDNSRYVFESNQILSDNIAEILVAAPNIDRGWALAAGQAITSGFWTMEEAQKSAIEIIQQDMQDALNEAASEAESPKSWWRKLWIRRSTRRSKPVSVTASAR